MRSTARRVASSWSWVHPPPRRCPSLPDRLGLRRPAPEARSVASRRCPLPAVRRRPPPRGDRRRRPAARRSRPHLRRRGQPQRSARRRPADHAERAAQGRAGARRPRRRPAAGRASGTCAGVAAATELGPGDPSRRVRGEARCAGRGPRPPPGGDGVDARGRDPRPSRPPGDGAAPPSRAVRPVRGRGQRRARRRDRQGARRAAGAPARCRAPRAARRGGRRITADPTAALDQAVDRLELLEVLCRTWRDALIVRAAVMGCSGPTMLRPPSPRPGSPARGRSRRQP